MNCTQSSLFGDEIVTEIKETVITSEWELERLFDLAMFGRTREEIFEECHADCKRYYNEVYAPAINSKAPLTEILERRAVFEKMQNEAQEKYESIIL